MSELRLSATIITRNEERNLEECLRSVSFVDEIIVLDAESNDRTVEIARRFTDKVHVEPWRGYGKQKNRAAQFASGKWILNIDADERVSPELKNEILGIIEHGANQFVAYQISRRNYVLGKWLRYGGWHPDFQLRLCRNGSAVWSETPVHEKLIVDGATGLLRGHLDHFTCRTLSEYIRRNSDYAHLAAQLRFQVGYRTNLPALPFKFSGKFFQDYVLKRGFFDGRIGLIMAVLGAAFAVTRDAMLWEISRSAREPDAADTQHPIDSIPETKPNAVTAKPTP